ncbi:OmpA family protein [Reichenbachiella versicolor]|uniref:OmpA family protein n=1 Tax=Reichenbachiella versicolor TaxID=1821036 RepID=UPI000D6E3C63|nr:OmpA family protein [Reichenbachiella versicolor]
MKTWTFTLFLFSVFSSLAQDGSLIRVNGHVTDSALSQPITANIIYEKLPYFDDIGTVNSNPANGFYEVMMIDGQKYSISVKAEGYESISEEIEIKDTGIGVFEKNFKLKASSKLDVYVLKDLIFERGKSEISEVSHSELNELARWLAEHPNRVIQLEGHTDFQGNSSANLILSEDRILATKKYLVEKGVKKSKIKTKAFGGAQPLTRDRTPEARALNRRVEVRVLKE